MRAMTRMLAALALLIFLAGCGREEAPKTGRIELASQPEGAQVFFHGQLLGVTPKVFPQAKPGHYRFRLEKPGCVPAWREFDLAPGATVTQNVTLTADGAAVLLTSVPAGAEVVIEGRNAGATPLLLTGQAPGHYEAQFRAPGCEERQVTWEVADSHPMEVAAQLESRVGSLEVVSDPAGARVILGGRELGVTPFSTPLDAGEYRLEVVRDGCRKIEETIYMQGGQNLQCNYKLQAEPGVIVIVTEPEKAQIRINDELRGIAPLELRDCAPGPLRIRAELEGFDPLERDAELAPGGELKLELVLRRNTGEIAFKVNLQGANVLLDGRNVAVVNDPEETITLERIAPGRHQLTVTAEGADPEVIPCRVEKARTLRLRPIELWRPNAEVKFRSDGRVERGMIYNETERDIVFGPEKGVKLQLPKSEFEYIKKQDFR